MIYNINEINHALSYFNSEKTKPKFVIEYNLEKNSSRDITPEKTIDFLTNHNILNIQNNNYNITDLGSKFLKIASYYEGKLHYELNEKQKYLLNTEIFLQDPTLLKDIADTTFHTDHILKQSYIKHSESDIEIGLMTNLLQSGLFELYNNDFYLNHKYKMYLRPGIISPERLQIILRENAEVGEKSELIVLEDQKRKQKELGNTHLVALIEKISDYDVATGYDIGSFTNNPISSKHDRFIEVKGTTNVVCDEFYITQNEVSTADELKEKYTLALVSNINSNCPKIIYVENSSEKILKNPDYEVEPILFRVKKRKKHT